jgi:hypothetical protein
MAAKQTPAERQAARQVAQALRSVAYYRRQGDEAKAAEFEAKLHGSGHCQRCGRTLTASADLGIGPECRKVA